MNAYRGESPFGVTRIVELGLGFKQLDEDRHVDAEGGDEGRHEDEEYPQPEGKPVVEDEAAVFLAEAVVRVGHEPANVSLSLLFRRRPF